MSTISSRRGAGSSKRLAVKSHNRRPMAIIAGIAAVSIAAVVALIAFQSFASSSTTIPPRIATGEGRILGDENARVTVVEYADFQCPVCKRAESSIISQIEKDYVQDGKVNIEFRMFPIIGQESFNAAQAAEAAREQGKFWEFHDALYNAQGRENGGAFSYDNLVAIAKTIPGLDVAEFEATFSSNKYLEPVQQEADTARDNGVSSTPTFFIGDTKITGAQPYAQFQAAIDAALITAGTQ